MFSHVNGSRLKVQSSSAATLGSIEKSGVRGDPDVDAMATLDDHQLAILLWNYHDDDVPGPAADIELSAANLPDRPAIETSYRIDQSHSNAYTTWHAMGSPAIPTPAQYAQLQAAGRLAVSEPPHPVNVDKRRFSARVRLPRQSVSLLVLTFN